MSKEDFIIKVKELHSKKGTISQKDIINEKGLNPKLVYKYFDGFSDLCKKLSLNTSSNLPISSDEMIDILKDIFNKNGDISRELINRDGRVSSDALSNRFGSLFNSYKEAGLNVTKGRKFVSKEEIDVEIFRILKEYGYVSKPLFEKFSTYSPKIVQRIYGSFSNMYTELNIPRHKSGIIPTDEDIEKECMRLYNEYKYLSYDIIEKFGTISITCLKDRARVKGWDGIKHYRNIVGCPSPDLDWGESQEARRIYNIYCHTLGYKGDKEKKFDWLTFEGNSLRIDMFFEKHKIAIEYNGPQHYFVDGFYIKTEEELQRRTDIDSEKYRLIKENGYKIIVIPFYDKVDANYVLKTINN